MTDTVAPNPPSPYVDADPAFRHLFADLMFLGSPLPGGLAFTLCERMAVVPQGLTDLASLKNPPEGLCPLCLAAAQGESIPEDTRERFPCTEGCGSRGPEGLCAMCRIGLHEKWARGNGLLCGGD